MKTTERLMLENHLAFLASHRGSIHGRGRGDTLFVESERPEFTYAILGPQARAAALPDKVEMVQHFPWSGTSSEELGLAGFGFLMGISYMFLEDSRPEWRLHRGLRVDLVTDQEQMDIFSRVQCRGFNESDESFNQWHPWLKTANDRNLHNPRQRFYVGSLADHPIGTTLTVESEDCVGIYAVATLAEHRKQGISTTVMRHAVRDAKNTGASLIVLQVKQDSYVEDFYRHLGFKRLFTTGMYRRNTKTGGK